jgi:hypothetical protein
MLEQYGTRINTIAYENIPKAIAGKNFRIHFRALNDHALRYPEYEIVIEASSIYRAQYACDLIICSLCLLNANPSISLRDMAVYPINTKCDPLFESSITKFQTGNILLCCKLAAKVSFHVRYVNAVNKYFLSCQFHSNDWVDLDPYSTNIPLSAFPFDHLRYGYAIIIAYSIIEELNIDIQASSLKPSMINGKWNPIVKENLEKRLAALKVDLDEPLLWLRRGAKNSLEQRKSVFPLKRAQWSTLNVRDCEVRLIDAINYISWLRSKIAAHKVDKDIRLLSVYDVSNAQHLARRLLLESLGFWRLDE